MYKSARTAGLILLITVVLLEIASWGILRFRERQNEANSQSSLFRQVSPDGAITPNKDYVLPMKLNSSVRMVSGEFNVSVVTNGRGLRAPVEIPNERVRVAFFGDSFTFGHGVEWEQIFSTVFSSASKWTGVTVANFSYINGFQPEHYEFFLRKNEDLRPDTVVVGLYLGNDLGSDLGETIYDPVQNELKIPLRRVVTQGNMAANPDIYVSPLDKLLKWSRFAELIVRVVNQTRYRSHLLKVRVGGQNEPNSEDLDRGREHLVENRAIRSLMRIQELQRKRGGNLTVLLIPQNFYFGTANPHISPGLTGKIPEIAAGPNLLQQMKQVCRQTNLDCFDPSPLLGREDYFATDAHWSASGHRKVGEALAEYIPLPAQKSPQQ